MKIDGRYVILLVFIVFQRDIYMKRGNEAKLVFNNPGKITLEQYEMKDVGFGSYKQKGLMCVVEH